jgi:chromosome segregation ATPase
VQGKLDADRQSLVRLEKELADARQQVASVRSQFEAANTRLSYITGSSEANHDDLEQALLIVRARKTRSATDKLTFLEALDRENRASPGDLMRELSTVKASYAETVVELDRTRRLLELQQELTKRVQSEMSMTQKQLQEKQKEYESRMEEMTHHLDARNTRLRRLEAQIHSMCVAVMMMMMMMMVGEDHNSDGVAVAVVAVAVVVVVVAVAVVVVVVVAVVVAVTVLVLVSVVAVAAATVVAAGDVCSST